MNQGKYIFAQLTDFLPRRVFDGIVSESFYIFDWGYVDFDRLCRVNESGAWFVTRAKKNFKFRRMYSREVDKSTGVLCDQIGKLEGFYPQKR